MIVSDAFRGKRYAVLGLARSGAATVRALVASGAEVTAWDENGEARTSLAPPLQGRGWGGGPAIAPMSNSGVVDAPHPNPSPEGEGLLELADPLEIDLTGFDGVVVSPGVPLNRHPIAAKARAAGVPVIGDIELFAQARASLPAHKVVGITGTNGKSTTTALVHHILKTAGVPTTMGGNIGLPILGQDPLPAGGVYVLELSSYQIDLTYSLDCDVAVLLNITPDHLDRYGSFEDYSASKRRLFVMQSQDHTALISERDREADEVAYQLEHEFGRWQNVTAFHGGAIPDQSRWGALQGPHNAENAAAAIETCRALGLSEEVIEVGLASYPGLPHRMERIRERDGVLYVNDSKATNATSTAPALAAYPAIHWILGGKRKTDDLDACAPYFDHVVAGYTIGEATELFAEILTAAGKPAILSHTLASAVQQAAAAARAGETVLFSPACASFDQFRDFEQRGDAFRALVEAL